MEDTEKKTTETQEQEKEGQKEKTFTQEEVNAMLQKEGDRRVSEAQKKFEKAKQEAIEEAKKMAAMDEAQKKEYELSLKQKELDEKIKELNLEKSKNEASKLLNDKKLSLELLDFVVAEDITTMQSRVDKLSEVFNAAVNTAAEERISSTNPKRGDNSVPELTVEQFKAMTPAQKQELYDKNPEAYMTISGRK